MHDSVSYAWFMLSFHTNTEPSLQQDQTTCKKTKWTQSTDMRSNPDTQLCPDFTMGIKQPLRRQTNLWPWHTGNLGWHRGPGCWAVSRGWWSKQSNSQSPPPTKGSWQWPMGLGHPGEEDEKRELKSRNKTTHTAWYYNILQLHSKDLLSQQILACNLKLKFAF